MHIWSFLKLLIPYFEYNSARKVDIYKSEKRRFKISLSTDFQW